MPVQARRLEVAEYQRFRDLVVTRLAAEAARSLGCGDAGLEAAEKALRRRRGRLQEHRRPAPQASRNAPDRRRRRRHHRPALSEAGSQRDAICNAPHAQTRTA